MIDERKNLFMIGGPNGSGKTTSAFSLMPELIHCEEYINADAIAASLSPFKPDSMSIKAGKLMLSRIGELANQNVSFAFETTMSSRSFVTLANQCKKDGYTVNLLYIWLNEPRLAVERVKSRVELGGHNIDETTIIRRYWRSMENLMNLYIPLADKWFIYDNSNSNAEIIADKPSKNDAINIYQQAIWSKFEEKLLC